MLALQGDFEAHRRALSRCGLDAPPVRLVQELEGLTGLVLPGGESTTHLRLIREYGFDEAILRFVRRGGAVYGTCAGAILLARKVESPPQWSLGLLDIDIERNAYGRQVDSFEEDLTEVAPAILDIGTGTAAVGKSEDRPPSPGPLPAVFIRAPRILRTGPGATVLASRGGEPVIVREGKILVSTFHPELTADVRVHRYFLEEVLQREAQVESPRSVGS